MRHRVTFKKSSYVVSVSAFIYTIQMILWRILWQSFHVTRPDWLKQRALSENKARVDDSIGWRSNFCFGILTNLTQASAMETSSMSSVNMAHKRPLLATVHGVKTVLQYQVLLDSRWQNTKRNKQVFKLNKASIKHTIHCYKGGSYT